MVKALGKLGHLNGTWDFKAFMALEHWNIWGLGHLKHLGTSEIKALGHLGTWTVGHLKYLKHLRELDAGLQAYN